MNRNHKLVLNLQRFAVQTTLLNSTGNDLSPEMKTYYDKELIRLAEPELVHDQFAQKKPIPKNGGKTIEFRKFDSLPKALTPLTEGVTPAGNKLNVSTVTATVSQYGDFISISDMLDMTAIDKVVLESLNQLGGQAGRTLDSITRDILAAGTNVIYAGGRTTRASLTTADKLEPELFFKAAAQLAAQNAKKIEGGYVAIIHPYTKYDLLRNNEFITTNQYSNAEKLFNGEIGKIGNVRFVESTEAKIWKDSTCPNNIVLTYGSNKTYANVYIDGVAATSDNDVKAAISDGKTLTGASGADISGVVTWTGDAYAVFSTLVVGADAYATTEIEGMGMQSIIKQRGSAGTADPLDQRSSVGWKATKVSEILVQQYMVRIESLSAYSTTATAN